MPGALLCSADAEVPAAVALEIVLYAINWDKADKTKLLKGEGHLKHFCPTADDHTLYQAVLVVPGEEEDEQGSGGQARYLQVRGCLTFFTIK